MQLTAVAQEKAQLRAECCLFRKLLLPEVKQAAEEKIARYVMESEIFQKCTVLFSYIAGAQEIHTAAFIEEAWKRGKKVAVPRCIPGDNRMEFHQICRWSELKPGAFHLLEPVLDCPILKATSHTLCILPGLCFDRFGNRLGYGKGYYDRYLQNYSGVSIGLCYQENLREQLPHEEHDYAVDMIVTEQGVFSCLNS